MEYFSIVKQIKDVIRSSKGAPWTSFVRTDIFEALSISNCVRGWQYPKAWMSVGNYI